MTPNFQYPAVWTDAPDKVLALLGSFWAQDYQGAGQLESLIAARCLLEAQTYRNTLETVACISRFSVPIWHKEHWYFLQLQQSQENLPGQILAKFDGGEVFDAPGEQFDVPPPVSTFTFSLPPSLRNAPLIMNRLTDPSVTLVQNVDYVIDTTNNLITFAADPFANPLIASRPVFADGVAVDQELALWLFMGDFDWQQIYNQFGYAIKLRCQSSPAYRDFLNAVLDGLVQGCSVQSLTRAFSAMTGIPCIRETSEVVEQIFNDSRQLLIITDQRVYKFPTCATAIVAVGDAVTAGQQLVDVIEVTEFGHGTVPDSLASLALGRGLISACYYGDLIFQNLEVPLEVDRDHPSGYAYVSFGVGGNPLDVRYFFDEIHARGIAAAEMLQDSCDLRRNGTLAMLMDLRPDAINHPYQPGYDLPLTINPLEFLVANVLRANAFVVQIKVSGLGSTGVGLYNLNHVRKLIPPGTAMLLVYEIVPTMEQVDGSELVQEDIGFFSGAEPLTDVVPVTYVREFPVGVKNVLGNCT